MLIRFATICTSLLLGLVLTLACSGDDDEESASPTPETGIHIDSIKPSSATIGDEIVITGSGFDPTYNDIGFSPAGMGTAFQPEVSSADGETLRFEIEDTLGACPVSQTRACESVGIFLPIGELTVSVYTPEGKSNDVTFNREVSPVEEAQAKS